MRKKGIHHVLILLLLVSIALVAVSSSTNFFTSDSLTGRPVASNWLQSEQFFPHISEQDGISSGLNGHPLSTGKNIQLPFTGFIQNMGQAGDDSVCYYFSSGDIRVGFGTSTVKFISFPERKPDLLNCQLELAGEKVDNWFSHQEVLDPLVCVIDFPGSRAVVPEGVNRKNHETNYFLGDLQLTGVPSWDEIWYRDLYPGIDLRYYISDQGLKYDFIVHPGADLGLIAVGISDTMALTVNSDTVSIHPAGEPGPAILQDTSLEVYQEDGMSVAASFILMKDSEQCYGFRVGSYDRSRTLIIDPLWLPFSSYLGGGTVPSAVGYTITVDGDGNPILAILTSNAYFPMVNSYNETHGGFYDILIAKFNSTGNGLLFSTYLGGSGMDYPVDLEIDGNGNIYVCGGTTSADMPVPNGYNTTFGGGSSYGDAYVAKLDSTGDLLYGTYLGGSGEDMASDIAVDGSGNCHATGFTSSTDFPAVNAYNSTLGGTSDPFITKLDPNGDVLFSTFLGGDDIDQGNAIAVDTAGNIYLTGETDSINFPTVNAYNDTHTFHTDIFVTKMNAAGTALVYSTFIGGNDVERGFGIAVDGNDNAFITGVTSSSDFPVENARYSTYSGGDDVILLGLNSTGNGLLFSTFLGDTGIDQGNRIALSDDGSITIVGSTTSVDFPLEYAYNDTHGGGYDLFVARFNPSGNSLLFSTFIGGSGDDFANSFALDAGGNMYVTGYTDSGDFPVVNAFNSTFSGVYDGFILKLSEDALAPSIDLVSPANGSFLKTSVQVDLDITDDGSGIDQVLYNWNNSANTTLSDPYDVLIPVTDGQHVLQVFANDTAGNWIVKTFVFMKDGSEPIITLVSPANNSIHRSGILIDLNVSDNIRLNQVLYHWDDEADQPFVEPYDLDLPVTEAQHVLQVQASDTTGNKVVKTFVFTTDDTEPVIELSSPDNESIHNSGISIDLDVTDNTGVIEFLYSWDGKDNITLAASYPLVLISGDGRHELQVFARDGASNWASQAFVFTTDDTKPVIVSLTGISQGRTVQFTVPVRVTAEDEFGIERVEFLLDGVMVQDDTYLPYAWSWNTMNTADGEHAVTIRVVDRAGNVRQDVITVNVANGALITGGSVAVLALVGIPAVVLVYQKSHNLRNRKVINLHEKSGMSVNDIARQTGKSRKKVIQILKKAKKMG